MNIMNEEHKDQELEGEDADQKMAFPNITEKELQRDLVGLHLPEVDLIEEGDFDARRKALIAKYGQEWYDEMMQDDEEEEEGPDEENKEEL